MPTPNGIDESWAVDFIADALVRGRRIRMLAIIDTWDRACPRIEADFSVADVRVVRLLEQLRQRGRRPNLVQVDSRARAVVISRNTDDSQRSARPDAHVGLLPLSALSRP
ncbi:hypothetical protein [Burkholderia anthina]|uniref:hypothetical protein n=1 Tax=Burkholderia anthina TaxID=179879 RepID=UPI0012DA0BCA|nr:hypothetical protein [Burkholderia anthina]